MGLKWGAIGNAPGEHIGNIRNVLSTWWEPIGNLKRISWDQRKNEKKSSPHQKLKRKKKKKRTLSCMLSLPIGCMKFLFPKLFVTIFGLGPIINWGVGTHLFYF
jgi:hypothetical protein